MFWRIVALNERQLPAEQQSVFDFKWRNLFTYVDVFLICGVYQSGGCLWCSDPVREKLPVETGTVQISVSGEVFLIFFVIVVYRKIIYFFFKLNIA